MNKVMVCFDGSDRARTALEKTMGFFKAGEKPYVIILTVVEPPLDATSVDEESFEKWKAVRKEELDEAAKMVASRGFEVDALLAEGDPRKMIVEAAEKKRPDIIVVARRGATKVLNMPLGSVSSYVVRHAGFPVIVV